MTEENTKKPIYKKWWVWVIAVIILAAIGAGQGEKGDNVVANKSTNKEIKPISVSIGELLSAYQGNEVGADVKYKDKYIQTTGIIGDIKKDIMDNLYVIVGKTGGDFEIPALQAFFVDEYTDQLANLKKGSKIEVICLIEGLMMHVLGKRCKIVQ